MVLNIFDGVVAVSSICVLIFCSTQLPPALFHPIAFLSSFFSFLFLSYLLIFNLFPSHSSTQVIHQNYYHSDLDKYRMVEGVATLHRKMLKVCVYVCVGCSVYVSN